MIICVVCDNGVFLNKRGVFVEIIVVDDNDNGLKFEFIDYLFIVKEDVLVGIVLYEFIVKDSDFGVNINMEFYIYDGN